MKIATIRDLRNRYTHLLDWINAGEEILISRRGRTIARLVPERERSTRVVDWSESPAVKRDRSDSLKLSASQSREIQHAASGKW